MDSAQEAKYVTTVISDLQSNYQSVNESLLSENALIQIAAACLEFGKDIVEILKRRLDYPDIYKTLTAIDDALETLKALTSQKAEVEHLPTPSYLPPSRKRTQ